VLHFAFKTYIKQTSLVLLIIANMFSSVWTTLWSQHCVCVMWLQTAGDFGRWHPTSTRSRW